MTSRTGPAGGLSAEWQHLSAKKRRVLDSVFLHVHCTGNKVSPRGAARRWQFDSKSRQTTCLSVDESAVRGSDVWFVPEMELGHWVTRSIGHLGHLSLPGHRVIILTRCETPSFSGFRKKCPKCKTYIWNGEMTKVIVRCLLLDWNHWMSVHVMNFYFYLWSLKILWPEKTSSLISRHLEFIIEQGHRVNWVSGSLDSRVTGSLRRGH